MQANVHLEAPRGGEALHAVLALEGLDARVRLDVGGQRALHGESPEALGALEGLLVGVDADVAHQIAGLAELLGTAGAHVPAHAILLADRPWGAADGPSPAQHRAEAGADALQGPGALRPHATAVCFLPRQRACVINCGDS